MHAWSVRLSHGRAECLTSSKTWRKSTCHAGGECAATGYRGGQCVPCMVHQRSWASEGAGDAVALMGIAGSPSVSTASCSWTPVPRVRSRRRSRGRAGGSLGSGALPWYFSLFHFPPFLSSSFSFLSLSPLYIHIHLFHSFSFLSVFLPFFFCSFFLSFSILSFFHFSFSSNLSFFLSFVFSFSLYLSFFPSIFLSPLSFFLSFVLIFFLLKCLYFVGYWKVLHLSLFRKYRFQTLYLSIFYQS